jgi:hypothetical protein
LLQFRRLGLRDPQSVVTHIVAHRKALTTSAPYFQKAG